MNRPASNAIQQESKVPGLRIGTKLVLTFLGFIFLLSISLFFTYQRYVPPLISNQIAQRTYAISKSLSSSIQESVITRNYLRVNEIAEITVKLPDVAYVAIINKRGIPIAGQFSDLSRFSYEFSQLVKEKGFPRELAGAVRMRADQKERRRDLVVGGQKVLEIAMPIGNSGSEAHVGIFTENIDAELQAALYPLLILLGVMAILGMAAIFLVARTVSRPIRQLTEQAHAISTGTIASSLDIKGGGEIWELARSFSRMQTSIQFMMRQIRKQRK